MIDILKEIQAYGWPVLGLITLAFIVGFALEDLFNSARGKGKHR